MKKYKVNIEETFATTIEVEAENASLAICKTEDDYNEGRHILTKQHFIGTDISLSPNDEEAKQTLGDRNFIEFVEDRFREMDSQIDIRDKIKTTFGSMDNALCEFKEHREQFSICRPKVYLLYRADAWLSHSSMELIAPFSSFGLVLEYLRRKQSELKLNAEDLSLFENYRQTQGLEENYLCETMEMDTLPEKQTEPEAKDKDFYEKVFVYGKSELSRGELESLPAPFDTGNVSDKQMERIVRETEIETRARLRLGEEESIDFNNDRHSEIWWEEMERATVAEGVPYYEDE